MAPVTYGSVIQIEASNSKNVDLWKPRRIGLALTPKRNGYPDQNVLVICGENCQNAITTARPGEFTIMPSHGDMTTKKLGQTVHYGEGFTLCWKDHGHLSWNNKANGSNHMLCLNERTAKGEMTMMFVKQGRFSLPVQEQDSNIAMNCIDSARKRRTSNKTIGFYAKRNEMFLCSDGKGASLFFNIDVIGEKGKDGQLVNKCIKPNALSLTPLSPRGTLMEKPTTPVAALVDKYNGKKSAPMEDADNQDNAIVNEVRAVPVEIPSNAEKEAVVPHLAADEDNNQADLDELQQTQFAHHAAAFEMFESKSSIENLFRIKQIQIRSPMHKSARDSFDPTSPLSASTNYESSASDQSPKKEENKTEYYNSMESFNLDQDIPATITGLYDNAPPSRQGQDGSNMNQSNWKSSQHEDTCLSSSCLCCVPFQS